MSENQSGDDQGQDFARQGKSGLSLPRKDAGTRPPGNRSRRKAGIYEKVRQAGQMDEGTAARWFIPLAALVVILLVAGIAGYGSQNNAITALRNEVAALRAQMESSNNADLGSRVDRVLARVDGLRARLDSVEDLNAELQAVRSTVAGQTDMLEALSGRLEALEQASSGSDSTDKESGDADAADAASPQPASASDQPDGGEWVLNLITVSDRTSAETVQKRLGEMGVESRIDPISRDGKSLLRVVVPGFKSRAEAEAAAPGIKDRLDLSGDPWIARQ